jgi:serine-type D-Ala-D-Ala carboxypeptidase
MTTSSAFPNIVSSTNVKNVQNANLKYGENFSSVQKIMSDAVEEGVFPGAVLNIAFRGTVLFEQGFGNRTNLPTSAPSVPMNPNFVFDVGELTGSLITTTLVLRLISQGYLSLADQVLRFIQGFGIQGKQSIRISHLLSHTAGLPSTTNTFQSIIESNQGSRAGIVASSGAKEEIIKDLCRLKIKTNLGEKVTWSNLGFFLLGYLVELVTGEMLDDATSRLILSPLGMHSTSYINISKMRVTGLAPVTEMIVPTEECSWRGKLLCGEAHDETCWVMGGVSVTQVFSQMLMIFKFLYQNF